MPNYIGNSAAPGRQGTRPGVVVPASEVTALTITPSEIFTIRGHYDQTPTPLRGHYGILSAIRGNYSNIPVVIRGSPGGVGGGSGPAYIP